MEHEEQDAGAVEAVAEQWRTVLEKGTPLIDPGMTRAAYAEPRLRQLYPLVSHGALQFSRCTRWPWTRDVGMLYRRAGGGYTVIRHSDGTTLGQPDTVEEAVSLIAENLPPGCGPVVEGTPGDL